MRQTGQTISEDVRDRILERLGFASPPTTDLDGLRSLYAAWCARVPFDNVRKMIALRAGDGLPLPGVDGTDFFGHWLAHGAGGTCWPTSNALFELVQACGFEARRVAGSMRDLGDVNHASVKVRIHGVDWLVDSSMLTNVPLRLDGQVFTSDDPVAAAEVEPVAGTHIMWAYSLANGSYLPCRLLVDPADVSLYRSGYEASRRSSPFNRRVYARRNLPGEQLVIAGPTRLSKTTRGIERRDLSPSDVRRALTDEIGLSLALVDEWVRCGGLEASFEPSSGVTHAPVASLPPSHRRRARGGV